MKFLTKFLIISFLLISKSYAFDPQSKPISVIIPFPPGGGFDVAFKNLQKYADEKKVNLVPIYKPGAEGMIATRELTKSKPDGYTVSLTSAAIMADYLIREKKNDFEILTGIRTSIQVMVTGMGSSIKNLKDLNLYVKNGNLLNFAHGSINQRLIFQQYFSLVKTRYNQFLISYKGTGPIIKDLIGNHVSVGVFPASAAAGLLNEKLRVIAVIGDNGSKNFSNFPRIENLFPSWKQYDGMALIVPRDITPSAKEWWVRFLTDYLNDPSVQKTAQNEYSVSLKFGTDVINSIVKNNVEALTKPNE